MFETHLPEFSHNLLTSERVIFENLSVRSSNAGIHAPSLYAEHATLKTSNASIDGALNTSTSLKLFTSNQPIVVAVRLTNAPKSGAPTKLVLKTSNSNVKALVSLFSSENNEGGGYDVNTETSNAELAVAYDAAPLGHTLIHRGKTSNALATLALHRAYEGTFTLRTSNSPPSVDCDNDIEDPAGRGRTRWVEVKRNVNNVLKGAVGWSKGGEAAKGSVDVQTSNSPVRLVLLKSTPDIVGISRTSRPA